MLVSGLPIPVVEGLADALGPEPALVVRRVAPSRLAEAAIETPPRILLVFGVAARAAADRLVGHFVRIDMLSNPSLHARLDAIERGAAAVLEADLPAETVATALTRIASGGDPDAAEAADATDDLVEGFHDAASGDHGGDRSSAPLLSAVRIGRGHPGAADRPSAMPSPHPVPPAPALPTELRPRSATLPQHRAVPTDAPARGQASRSDRRQEGPPGGAARLEPAPMVPAPEVNPAPTRSPSPRPRAPVARLPEEPARIEPPSLVPGLAQPPRPPSPRVAREQHPASAPYPPSPWPDEAPVAGGPPDDASSERALFDELRVFFVGSDPGRGDLFARALRALGATVALSGPRGEGFASASRIDPHVVVVEVESLDDTHVEIVRKLQQDLRLRWAPLCPIRWEDVTTQPAGAAAARLETGVVAARIRPLVAGDLELVRRLGSHEGPIDVGIETLGFPRLLRVVERACSVRRLRLREGVIRADVDVSGSLVVAARWSQTQPIALELEGPRALAALLTLREGRVEIGARDLAVDANVMRPFSDALDAAVALIDEVAPLLPTASYRMATHPAPEAPMVGRRSTNPLPVKQRALPAAPPFGPRSARGPAAGEAPSDDGWLDDDALLDPEAVTVVGEVPAPMSRDGVDATARSGRGRADREDRAAGLPAGDRRARRLAGVALALALVACGWVVVSSALDRLASRGASEGRTAASEAPDERASSPPGDAPRRERAPSALLGDQPADATAEAATDDARVGAAPEPEAPWAPEIPKGAPRDVSDALLEQAAQHLDAGERARGLATLEAALEADANNPHVHAALAAYHLDADDPAAALPHARGSVALRPRGAEYRLLLGDVLAASGDIAGAVRAYLQARSLDRDLAGEVRARLSSLPQP